MYRIIPSLLVATWHAYYDISLYIFIKKKNKKINFLVINFDSQWARYWNFYSTFWSLEGFGKRIVRRLMVNVTTGWKGCVVLCMKVLDIVRVRCGFFKIICVSCVSSDNKSVWYMMSLAKDVTSHWVFYWSTLMGCNLKWREYTLYWRNWECQNEEYLNNYES